MAKQEYFLDVYKNKRLGDMEVKVKAIYDKNGKPLYNGAKAILDVSWGDGIEVGKIVVYEDVFESYENGKFVGFVTEYNYGFKPKKGSALYIQEDGSNVELI